MMPEYPILGFCAGFAIHFIFDAIPHYDYPIYSRSVHPEVGAPMRFDKNLLHDMVDIGVDASLGILLSLFFFATPAALVAVLAGALGGILPDFLQFVYAHFKHEPLVSLQHLHRWIHAKRRLEKEHKLALGIISQIAIIAAIVVVTKSTAALL